MCVYLGMRLEKGQFSGADFVLSPGWGRVSLTVSANLYTPGYPSHQFPGDCLWHASPIEVLRLQMWGTKSGLLHIPGLKLTWSGRFVWNVLSPWTLTGPSVDFNLLLGGGVFPETVKLQFCTLAHSPNPLTCHGSCLTCLGSSQVCLCG